MVGDDGANHYGKRRQARIGGGTGSQLLQNRSDFRPALCPCHVSFGQSCGPCEVGHAHAYSAVRRGCDCSCYRGTICSPMPSEKPTDSDGCDGSLSSPELAGAGHGRDSNLHLDQSASSDLAHYRDLFENAPCGYLVLDMDGSILSANAGFLHLAGLSKGQEAGLNFRKLLSSAGAIFYDSQVLPPLLLSGTRGEIALDLRVDSRRIPVLANFSLEYQSGNPIHIRVVLFNATE